MRIFRKSKSIIIILIVLFLVYTTTVSALTRDDIVDFAKGEVGSHYIFGAHGNEYKNDFGKDKGLFWDDEDRYWKFETTCCVWHAHSDNSYLSLSCDCANPPCTCSHSVCKKGKCVCNNPPCYQYWDHCQGYGGGTRTNCSDVAHYDCIGLVDVSYRNAGAYTGWVWTVSSWLATKHMADVKREHLQSGDLGYVGAEHIGIYVGNGHFVHANGHDRGVVCDSADRYNKWTRFGRALPSPLIQTVTVTSNKQDYLECPALNPDNLNGSNFDKLGTCRFIPEEQEITVRVTWEGGENNARRHSWRYSSCFGYLGSDWIDDTDGVVEYKWRIDRGHLIDSDLRIQVRNEYGSIDTIDIHFEGNAIDVFVIKPNGFVQEGNRITHKNLSWTFGAECNNAYRSKSGEIVPPNEVSDINEAIDILGWEKGGEFIKIDGHDAYCIENIRQYSGIDQIYLIDWGQEPCRSETLLTPPPGSPDWLSRCDVIDAHYSSIFSSFPDWLNDVAYSGDAKVYYPIDVTMHYRYQDMVFDAMDKSTERGLISKAEAELSIAYYVPHLSFTSASKNVLVFLKDTGWVEIHYNGDSFFEEDLDVLDEMLRSVKIRERSDMGQWQYMCRLCTIAITPPTTSQQLTLPLTTPQETVPPSKTSASIIVDKIESLSIHDTHINHDELYNFDVRWSVGLSSITNLDRVTYTIITPINFTYLGNYEQYWDGTENDISLPYTSIGQNYTWVLPSEVGIKKSSNKHYLNGTLIELRQNDIVPSKPLVDMVVDTTNESNHIRVNVHFVPVEFIDSASLTIEGQIIDVSIYPSNFVVEKSSDTITFKTFEGVSQSQNYSFSVLLDELDEIYLNLFIGTDYSHIDSVYSDMMALPIGELGNVTVMSDIPVKWDYYPGRGQDITIEFGEEDENIPGFETVFTIIGLLAVAYLLRRRK